MSYTEALGIDVGKTLTGAVSFYGQSQQDKALADQARAGQAGAVAPAGGSGFPILPVVIGGAVLLGAFMLMKKKGATANPGRRRRRRKKNPWGDWDVDIGRETENFDTKEAAEQYAKTHGGRVVKRPGRGK